MDTEQKSGSKGIWIVVIIVIIVVLAIIYYASGKGGSSTAAPAPTDTSAASAPAVSYTLSAATSPTLGAYLTATNNMTLYVFTNDKTGKPSTCNGPCATQWPPYTLATSSALSVASNATGTIGTSLRSDGTSQVTYNGLPVYFFYKDVNPGDTNGNGVGGVWYVAKP